MCAYMLRFIVVAGRKLCLLFPPRYLARSRSVRSPRGHELTTKTNKIVRTETKYLAPSQSPTSCRRTGGGPGDGVQRNTHQGKNNMSLQETLSHDTSALCTCSHPRPVPSFLHRRQKCMRLRLRIVSPKASRSASRGASRGHRTPGLSIPPSRSPSPEQDVPEERLGTPPPSAAAGESSSLSPSPWAADDGAADRRRKTAAADTSTTTASGALRKPDGRAKKKLAHDASKSTSDRTPSTAGVSSAAGLGTRAARGKGRAAKGGRGRGSRVPETRGVDSDSDSDVETKGRAEAKRAAQQKLIEDMMSQQVRSAPRWFRAPALIYLRVIVCCSNGDSTISWAFFFIPKLEYRARFVHIEIYDKLRFV